MLKKNIIHTIIFFIVVTLTLSNCFKNAAPEYVINITNEQVQYVRGFGGTSSVFGIGEPAEYLDLSDVDTLFNPETGLGLNILRIRVFPHPLDEILQGLHYDGMGNQNYIDIVKKVNQYGGYVTATPWTPPAEYKTNDFLSGDGKLKQNMYGAYANYLKKFAQEMADRGAPIFSISVQNEPNVSVQYDGMLWEQNDYFNWMKDNAPLFHNPPVQGFGGGKIQERVLLIGGEHSFDIAWNDSVLNDSNARANIDIAAYHNYYFPNTIYLAARQEPDKKEIWMTEVKTNYSTDLTDDILWEAVWGLANEINSALVDVNASAFIWWYAKRFYSFLGDGSFGTVNGEKLFKGYVISHYAKYAADTVRLKTSDNFSDLLTTQKKHNVLENISVPVFGVSAFIRKSNPDMSDFDESKLQSREDSISLVIYYRINDTSKQDKKIRVNLPEGFSAANAFGIITNKNEFHAPLKVDLEANGKYADITLPYDSIVSVKYVKREKS